MGPFAVLILIALTISTASAGDENCIYLFSRGPLWSFLNFFNTPDAVKRAESIKFIAKNAGTGTTSGKMIIGIPDGSPLERFAYRIEKVTGFRVTLSDGANQMRGAEGFTHDSLSVLRKSGEEKLSILNLGKSEARSARPTYIAVHESTHAYFDFLDRTGEGTPLSVAFQDFGMNYVGPYSTWMSAQELKTWSQDVVRVLRKDSEPSNLRKFTGGKSVKPSALFTNLGHAIEKLEILEKLSARSETDLVEALAWLRAKTTFTVPQFELMLFTRMPEKVLQLNESLEILLNNNRKLYLPLNTLEERALALESQTATPERFKEIHETLVRLWIDKLESLKAFNTELAVKVLPQVEQIKILKRNKSLSLDEYREIRRQLSEFGNLGRTFGMAKSTP